MSGTLLAMTSQQNERHLHVKVPQKMKQDLEAKAAKLGVSEAKLVRDALKAQGYGVRWSAPPPGVISEERPAMARGARHPALEFGQKFEPASRALMQPEA